MKNSHITWAMFLVCALLGCRNDIRGEIAAYHKTIPTAHQTRSDEPFPLPNATPEQVVQKIMSADSISDVFEISHLVKLEVTDHSLISFVSEFLYLDGHYFILDGIQNQIYKFSPEGKFIKQIGRKGQGPGEYLGPHDLTVVWGKYLGLVDGQRGRLMVLDTDGNLIRETPPPGSGAPISYFPIVHPFIWNRPDRFFLANFSNLDPLVPQHIALDMTEPGGHVLFGFGERFLKYENWNLQRKAPRASFSGFLEINNKIWAANRIFSDIEVYNMDGAHLDTLHGAHPLYISRDDYDDISPSKDALIKLWIKKIPTVKLVQCQSLVVQLLGGGRHHFFNIYDENGALLNSALEATFLQSVLIGAYQNKLVTVCLPVDEPGDYPVEARSFLEKSGWTPESHLEDNPYLVISSAQ